MRVMITADVEGGVWSYAVCLATELASSGCAVLLAVVGSPGPRHLRDLPEGVEVVARPFRLEWMTDPGDDLDLAGEWLAATARRWRADVVHLNQLTYATHSFGAPTVVVVHSDVLSWFSTTLGHPAPGDQWSGYAARVVASLRAADAVVAVSRWQADLVRSEYDFTISKVIHNGIQVESFQGPLIAERAPAVLTMGRAWDRAKGIGVLDEAIGLLDARAPEATFIGGTEGPNGERFTPVNLRSVGAVSRRAVPWWLNRASVYVAPAYYEPFGLAVLEAAAHGCALILSDIGSFRELWDECALFVPSGDAAALADGIQTLMDDQEALRTLTLNARQRAIRAYGSLRFADDYRSLYRSLMPKEAPHPYKTEADLLGCN